MFWNATNKDLMETGKQGVAEEEVRAETPLPQNLPFEYFGGV
jgi:hypothetical protein